MNPIDFIFRLLQKFVIVSDRELASLEQDGKSWWLNFIAEAEKSENASKKKIAEVLTSWWARTALAVFFIFAVRWVSDFMNGTSGKGEEDEE